MGRCAKGLACKKGGKRRQCPVRHWRMQACDYVWSTCRNQSSIWVGMRTRTKLVLSSVKSRRSSKLTLNKAYISSLSRQKVDKIWFTYRVTQGGHGFGQKTQRVWNYFLECANDNGSRPPKKATLAECDGAYLSNPNTRELGAGGFLSLRSAKSTLQVPGQLELYHEALYHNQTKGTRQRRRRSYCQSTTWQLDERAGEILHSGVMADVRSALCSSRARQRSLKGFLIKKESQIFEEMAVFILSQT